MRGVSCLQDLKPLLEAAGFEAQSFGWYIITVHGSWGMTHGDVFLNGNLIKNISDAPIPVKPKKKKVEIKEQANTSKKKLTPKLKR